MNELKSKAGATLLALESSAVVPLDDVDANEEPKTNRPEVTDAAVAVKPAALPDELIPKKG